GAHPRTAVARCVGRTRPRRTRAVRSAAGPGGRRAGRRARRGVRPAGAVGPPARRGVRSCYPVRLQLLYTPWYGRTHEGARAGFVHPEPAGELPPVPAGPVTP